MSDLTVPAKMPCPQCKHDRMTIGEARNIVGHAIYPHICAQCGEVQHHFASKTEVAEFKRELGSALPRVQTKIEADPVRHAQRVEAAENRICEVCGEGHAQRHHWAPRHLFFDQASNWPTSLLCQACHTRWHQIVTPKMSEPRT